MTRATGTPRGRPTGTGRLGTDQVRVTVRLPRTLYARLEAFAAGRSSLRWSDDTRVADVVRDALDHYLACPQRRVNAEE